MTSLVEFKVTKTLFDEVKNDQEFRIGFEAEFYVRNASYLLRDEHGRLPQDFRGYEIYGFPEETTLYRLARLFESHLGLGQNAIEVEDNLYKGRDYTNWKLTIDESLWEQPAVLDPNEDYDIGVELVSPVMPLKEGLAWIAKVFQMIASYQPGGFQHGDIKLYTNTACGFHLNLSHIRMGLNFDFAKLAILSGDEHYLKDFQRLGNKYAAPLLQTVYSVLVAKKEKPAQINTERNTAALNLLKLRGWSPRRVMTDLAALIPMHHHMSIDLSRLDTNNPYIEIRIAGNTGYESRFEDIAQLAIRFGALIKIGCDEWAYREEYLKKIYQLVTHVTAAAPTQQQAPENPFPRIRLYLMPVMSAATRAALDRLETYWRGQTLSSQNGSYLFLAIVRSAFDMRQQQNQRVRQGLLALLQNVLRIAPKDLLKALRNNALLAHYEVLHPSDKNLQIIAAISNYVTALNQPVTRSSLMNHANQQALQDQEERLVEEKARRRKRAKRDAEQKRRNEQKEKKQKILSAHR